MSDIIIRPIQSDEYPAFATAIMEGFSEDLPDKGFPALVESVLPPERTLAAFDGDTIVGTFGGFDLELTVPGGRVPMEGTTAVTVFPTHRRMGLMDSMMATHLDTAAANGYPIAGLWASGSGIYGRHGYGIATRAATRTVDGPSLKFRDGIEIERVRRVDAGEAAVVLPGAFDVACDSTPGMMPRDETWWNAEILSDEEWMKRGRTHQRIVVHDGPDGVDGYVIYRQKASESDDVHANGTVSVSELIAATPTALASLWSYVTNIDGCPKVRYPNMPVNDDVLAMVTEPRKFATTAYFDALWVRILDVEAALKARAYDEDGVITFRVIDPFRPDTEGVYRLCVIDGVAECDRVDDPIDLEIDVDILGALYLGGADATTYAAAGRVRGAHDDVVRLHRLFRTVATPWCNQVF